MRSTLLAVWLLHVAALVTPGANVLLVSHLAAKGDRRGAVYAALGVSIGALVWATAAVLGVSVLFTRVPGVRLALQIAGALYLIHVAIAMLRVPVQGSGSDTRLADRQALRAGLLTNLSNPKAALFFGGIFTAALPMHAGATLLAASVALILVNALAWHLLLAFVCSRPRVQRAYASGRGLLSRVAGVVVGTIGAWLLVAAIDELR